LDLILHIGHYGIGGDLNVDILDVVIFHENILFVPVGIHELLVHVVARLDVAVPVECIGCPNTALVPWETVAALATRLAVVGLPIPMLPFASFALAAIVVAMLGLAVVLWTEFVIVAVVSHLSTVYT
jgi:hypothetical protein